VKLWSFYEKFGFTAFAENAAQKWLIVKNATHVIGLFQGMFEKIIDAIAYADRYPGTGHWFAEPSRDASRPGGPRTSRSSADGGIPPGALDRSRTPGEARVRR
jgi:hypothetical protein